MGSTVIYEVRNVKTGEKFTGTAKEVAEKFGVTRGYISLAEIEGRRIRFDWAIKKVGNDTEKEVSKSNIPMPLFEEWDKVTAQFKQASRKKALC